MRLELQSEKGDTEICYDGHTVSIYDASSNTLYRYTPPAHEATRATAPARAAPARRLRLSDHERPRTADRREDRRSDLPPRQARERIRRDTDRHRRPARLHGARLAQGRRQPARRRASSPGTPTNGVPLRAAIYSSTSSSPVIELTATAISYGPVEASVFEFTPPANAKIEESTHPHEARHRDRPVHAAGDHPPRHDRRPRHLVGRRARNARPSDGAKQLPTRCEGTQKVKIDGVDASELPTALGTLLSFERSGVRYLLVGAVSPRRVEAVARGPLGVAPRARPARPSDGRASGQGGGSRQALQGGARGRRRRPERARRRGLRLPRPQWRGQDDDAADAARADHADRGHASSCSGATPARGRTRARRASRASSKRPASTPISSGRKNLEMMAALDGGDAARRVEEVLRAVDLVAAQPTTARAPTPTAWASDSASRGRCCASPRLLILDEPATGLDPAGMRDMRAAHPPARRRGDHRAALEPPAAGGAGSVRPRRDRRRAGRVVYEGAPLGATQRLGSRLRAAHRR